MTDTNRRKAKSAPATRPNTKTRLPVFADDPNGLPFFSARWVPAILHAELPEEPIATCGDCAMLPPEGEPFSGSSPYFAKTKCCTYVPTTANFLVGGLFLDPDPALGEGRRRTAERIAKRTGLSPLGLGPSAHESLTLDHVTSAFGKHRALVCPSFQESDGSCTVWRYRTAVCMTWFCKHVRGATGKATWRATEHFVRVLERAVSYHCLLEVGLGSSELAHLATPWRPVRELSPQDLDGGEDEDTRADWGTWFGKEREFFEACAKGAFKLTPEDVVQIGGSELAVARRAAEGALARHDQTTMPKRLVVKPFEILSIGPEVTRLKTYSPYDPLEVPNALLPLLALFDGRPTKQVVKKVLADHGVDLDDEVLGQLLDFELLAAAP